MNTLQSLGLGVRGLQVHEDGDRTECMPQIKATTDVLQEQAVAVADGPRPTI
jgi:hypothetical protein